MKYVRTIGLIVAVYVVIGLAAVPSHAITFSDGLLHTIDSTNSYPLESLIVENSSGGESTGVHIVPGGEVGTYRGDGLSAYGSSEIEIVGGQVGGIVASYDSSLVTMTSGAAGSLAADGKSRVKYLGGTVGSVGVAGNALVEVLGGVVGDTSASGGQLTIQNAHVQGYVVASGSARLSVHGGTRIDHSLVTLAGATSEIQGGEVPSINAGSGGGERSTTIISGGTIGEVSVANPAGGDVHFLGGLVTGDVYIRGNGSISGGEIRGNTAADRGELIVSAGELGGDLSVNSSTTYPHSLHLSGGLVEGQIVATGDPTISIAGGTISGGLRAMGDTYTEVTGGMISGSIRAEQNSRVQIRGGSISANLLAFDNVVIEIIGRQLNLPLGIVDATSGTVFGVLADGSPIDLDFARATSATILITPEPSTALLVGAGLMLLAAHRARGGS